MNAKRFVLASLAVFVAAQILGFVIHGVLLQPAYQATQDIWRQDVESRMWIVWLSGLLTAPLFVYIFIKGYEGKGVMEGLRFGLIIGLFTSIPLAYGAYAVLPIPYSLALQWFLYGTAEVILLGVVAASVYRPAESR